MLSLRSVVLWYSGPRSLHSCLMRCSGVCVFSFSVLPNDISQNEHPLFSFLLIASFPFGLTFFGAFSLVSQEPVLETQKNEHLFFLFPSSFNPISAQDNMDKLYLAREQEAWERKKNKN